VRFFLASIYAPSTISHEPIRFPFIVPPSGAPGFAGDSAWDKGFSNDYFDNERVDKKMELVDLVHSYLFVSCFVFLPTDDPWLIDTSTPPRSRPPSAHMATSLQLRPTWHIAQHFTLAANCKRMRALNPKARWS
jgi:hypothetical protein